MFEFFGGKNETEPTQEKNESVEVEEESKKLERINSYIENTNDPDLRKILIDEAEKLNESLAVLEISSGLSEDQIMNVYKKMSRSPEVAKEIVSETISANPKKFIGVENASDFLSIVRETLSPPRLATLAAAVAVVIAISSEAGAADIIKKEINKEGSGRRSDQQEVVSEGKESVFSDLETVSARKGAKIIVDKKDIETKSSGKIKKSRGGATWGGGTITGKNSIKKEGSDGSSINIGGIDK